VHSDEIVVVLRLFDKQAHETSERRTVTAALLNPTSGSARFAIEVTRVVALVSAQPLEAAGPWVLKVSTTDGRTLPWLLVDRVLSELGVVAA
jgi:hypothetical protein